MSETGVNFEFEAGAQDTHNGEAYAGDLLERAAPVQAEVSQEQEQESAQGTTGAEPGDAGQQPEQPPAVYRSQAEVDAAIGARLRTARERVLRENKPLLDKGALLERYTQGMTDEEISTALQAMAASRLAKDEGVDEKTALAIVKRTSGQTQPRPQAPALSQQEDATTSARQRISAMADYMQAIGAPDFTLEALRTNRSALQDFADGMGARELYMKHFRPAERKAAPPVERRGASVSGNGETPGQLSNAELDRIVEAAQRGYRVRFD